MTKNTPATESVRNIYATSREEALEWDGESDDQTIFEVQDEFDRWLAEVERAAAEKAWDEGYGACWTYHTSEGLQGATENPFKVSS